ncbi:C2H2 domain-containing protein [Vairimorpha necatrix]|uniref:C2H2 domain-containing protein n=1 Tax=Vairimorpha necatrix TaxID=6039 RepID=A0AAX4JD92_9MICR
MNYKKIKTDIQEILRRKNEKHHNMQQSSLLYHTPTIDNFEQHRTSINEYNKSDFQNHIFYLHKRERIQNMITINGQSFYSREGKVHEVFCCVHPGCNKIYMNKYSLKYHAEKGHITSNLDINKPYACNFFGCTRRYKNKSTLIKHVADTHLQRHKY